MTLKGFREKIAESDNAELLNSLIVKINYPHLNYSITLNGLANVYQFVLKQVKGWNDFENLSPELLESKSFFEKIKRQILNITSFFQRSKNITLKVTGIPLNMG